MIETALVGLTEAEVTRRLEEDGYNELPRTAQRSLFRIMSDTMREPMFMLLMGAAVLYLVLGGMGEGIFLFIGAVGTIGLVIFQEARSERALTALRELAQPQVRVIRDNTERLIPARELVRGDLLLVGEGERVPADGLLIAGDVLSVDESALTGESAPVSKRLVQPDETFGTDTSPGEDASPYVFSGTLLVAGQGLLRVARTGVHSALGRIGVSLASIEQEQTPLQKTAGRLVALLGMLALVFCAAVVVAYGLFRDDWTGGALAGITVAIALIPEEFPMVLAVFMALGAWRMASQKVLVRRSAVIEALGGATVLCVDKTGTLTENRMRVARLWTESENVAVEGGTAIDASGAARRMLDFAALASAERPVDPMDKAIRESVAGADPSTALKFERGWPLRPELLAVIQVWRGNGEQRKAGAKGAPEAIFRLCRLSAEQVQNLQHMLDVLGTAGLRVLGVASCELDAPFPDVPETLPFHFEGLVGFLDPLRAAVPAAVVEAGAAGIQVVMITGDHPTTAMAIASGAGIDTSGGCLLGSELAQMSSAELVRRVQGVRVFARVAPEQKLLLVQTLRGNREVVAMTGDGVNDAPALEAAHIGIAMGKRGTDVAREAADLVLLDDSFTSIVAGIRLGRRIFANLRRALTYITAIHVPIGGLALLPILMGLPPMLFPMHVVLLELAIDPICALVFESEPSEDSAMRQPPRDQDEALFGVRQLMSALVQGIGVLIGVLGIYMFLLQAQPEAVARGAAFITLVIANLLLALADTMAADARLFGPHRRLFWYIASAVLLMLIAIYSVPQLAAIFQVQRPDVPTLLLALGVAAVSGLWLRFGAALLRGMGDAQGKVSLRN